MRWTARALATLSVLAAALFVLYRVSDPERLDLDDGVRAAAAGRFARLTDGYTHYELGGQTGTPVVVLAAGFSVPYYIWDPTFDALTKAGFRVLRYDYFGRGLSDRPDVPYDESLYVRQLKELLDAARITEPVDLAGLSMGAAVVTSFADRYPDRVRSLIYVDPSFRSPAPGEFLEAHPRLWDLRTVLVDERTWAGAQMDDFVHPERFADWPARYRVQMQYRGFRRARLSEIVTNGSVDQGSQLDRVSRHPRPVLVLWGKQDNTVPFALAPQVMRALPRARLVAVDDAGHLPQMEQPAVFNAALVEFLAAASSRDLTPAPGPTP